MTLTVMAFDKPGRDPDPGGAGPSACPRLALLAVVGRLSYAVETGRAAPGRADPVITPLVDLCLAVLPGTDVVFHDGTDPAAAVAACAGADAVVVVVAVSNLHRGRAAGILTGDGGRAGLRLSATDERLVDAVSAAHPRTTVAVVAGNAVLLERRWDTTAAPGADPPAP